MQKLSYDPTEAVIQLSAGDPIMARLIHEVGDFALELHKFDDTFQSLLRSIVFQQLSGKAANTIHGRVLDLMSGKASPAGVLSLEFDQLRSAGLSRAKTLAVTDLAERDQKGEIPTIKQLQKMDDDAIIEKLTAVRGIGPWTVQMLLIFKLGRPDVLPSTDLGVQKGYQRTYKTEELPKPKALRLAGEVWKPFRSIASWYLWRAVDLNRETPDAPLW